MIEYPENIVRKERVLARSEHGTMGYVTVNHYKTRPVDPTGFLKAPATNHWMAGRGCCGYDPPPRESRPRSPGFIRNVFATSWAGMKRWPTPTLIAADQAYRESNGSFRTHGIHPDFRFVHLPQTTR